MIISRLKKLSNSEKFLKNVFMLVGSTIFSQAILIAILPILTRLYTPNDFGVLGLYTSLVAIFSTSACLRYDIPITLVRSKKTSDSLLLISIITSFVFCLFLLIILVLFDNTFVKLIDNKYFEKYLYLLPLGVFCTSIFTAITFWKSQQGAFREISILKCKQAVFSGGIQIVGGFLFFSYGALFLILGYLANNVWGIFNYFFEFFKNLNFRKKQIQYILYKYRDYPKYSSVEALFNNLAIFFPLVYIAKYVSIAETGFLALAIKLMQIPMKLVGNSIAQVFVVSAAKKYRENKLDEFTKITINRLIKVGIGPIIFIGIIAPEACEIIFGNEWYRIGILITMMIPWFCMQFLASPIAMLFHITNNQKNAMIMQFFNVAIRVFPLFFLVYFNLNFLVEYYAISGFVFYFFYFVCSFRLANVEYREIFIIFLKNIHFILFWVILGFLISLFF